MQSQKNVYPQAFARSVFINAPPMEVWKALTLPELMKRWMSDSEMDIDTTWQIGAPIITKVAGVSYKTAFVNTGTVMQFAENSILAYTHLSSLSQLDDGPENHTMIRFTLHQKEGGCLLRSDVGNFPTDSHYHHLYFYWTVTLEVLKQFVEGDF